MSKEKINTIKSAIEEFKNGQMLIVVDDEGITHAWLHGFRGFTACGCTGTFLSPWFVRAASASLHICARVSPSRWPRESPGY